MSDFMNHVKTVNSSVRTLLILAACGVIGYFGYFGYQHYVKPSHEAKQAIADLATLKEDFEKQEKLFQKSQKELAKVTELNERMATSLKLLKVDKRVANIEVLSIEKDEEGNPLMELCFTEIGGDGEAIGISKTTPSKVTNFSSTDGSWPLKISTSSKPTSFAVDLCLFSRAFMATTNPRGMLNDWTMIRRAGQAFTKMIASQNSKKRSGLISGGFAMTPSNNKNLEFEPFTANRTISLERKARLTRSRFELVVRRGSKSSTNRNRTAVFVKEH